MLKELTLHLAFLLLVHGASAQVPQNVAVSKLGKEFELVGKLHAPLGRVLTIRGVVDDGPAKGFEGGPNLRVQQIDGSSYQEDIQIVLKPFFYDWGQEPLAGGIGLPKLEMGKTYEMEGYETGGYIGSPSEIFRRGAVVVQTTNHYFRTQFVAIKAREIEPILFAPSMFRGQKALLSGTARNQEGHAVMQGLDWAVVVSRGSSWPQDIIGKRIETHGWYNPDATWKDDPNFRPKVYDLVEGRWRLVELQDQVGKQVHLRGRARSLNGVWWFDYRGIDLYVEDLEQLPGWTEENRGRPMVIEGRLEKATLPRLDQVTEKVERDLAEYFIVRGASWNPLPALLSPERALSNIEQAEKAGVVR